MSQLKDLTCEKCGRESKARVVIHCMLDADIGPIQCHIYENGWIGECEGVDICPRCDKKVTLTFYGMGYHNRVKSVPKKERS